MALHLDRKHRRLIMAREWSRCAILCLGFLFLSGPLAFAQQKVGFILDIRGQWTDGESQGFVKLGQLLPGESLLANRTPVDGDRVVIANMHGEVIKTIRCKEAVCRECTASGSCYDPIHPLPKATEPANSASVLLNAVLDLFAEKPERYSLHRVRGPDADSTNGAVLRVDSGAVDFRTLLTGKEKGHYEVELIPISRETHGNEPSPSFRGDLNWNPGEKAILPLQRIASGLYEARVYHGSAMSSTWVLLSTGAEFQSSLDAYEEFVRRTEGWGDSLTPATKQAYQRAFLEYLNLHHSGSAQ